MKLASVVLIVLALAMTVGAQTANQQSVPLSSLTIGTEKSSITLVGSIGEPILTCKSSPDGFTMSGCEIAKGHTLDEAMTDIYMSMSESNRAYGRDEDNYRKAIELQQKVIKAQKSEIAILTKALKADQEAFRKMQDLFLPKGGPRT